jgi:hypothetical protein
VNLITRVTVLFEKLNHAAAFYITGMYDHVKKSPLLEHMKIQINPVTSSNTSKMHLTVDLTSISVSPRLSLSLHKFVRHYFMNVSQRIKVKNTKN